ncbi:hypothetical protein [Nocardioides pacificus]
MDDVAELLERLPEGYCTGEYDGRRWGVTTTIHLGGRSLKVYAEELGGTDFVSANLYRVEGRELFRPCEMPADKVVRFLRGLVVEPAGGAAGEPAGESGERHRPATRGG